MDFKEEKNYWTTATFAYFFEDLEVREIYMKKAFLQKINIQVPKVVDKLCKFLLTSLQFFVCNWNKTY